jgi:hypothetical protein
MDSLGFDPRHDQIWCVLHGKEVKPDVGKDQFGGPAPDSGEITASAPDSSHVQVLSVTIAPGAVGNRGPEVPDMQVARLR